MLSSLKKIYRCHCEQRALRQQARRPITDSETLVRVLCWKFDRRILTGPFQGLRYGDASFGSMHLPKLLGTYEMELAGHFHLPNLRGYGVFVNLGCAEGYYANGIAHVLKKSAPAHRPEIMGVDLDANALVEAQRIAERNGLQVMWSKTPDWAVVPHAPGPALVICDVEGAELELLDPVRVPALKQADFIVEIHDDPGQTAVLDEMQARFAPTHESSVISASPRQPCDFPATANLAVADPVKVEAMNERRAKGFRWLILHARQRSRETRP